MNTKSFTPIAALAALACLPSLASAQAAGTWSGRLSVTQIDPQVNSGDLTPSHVPGVKVDITSATRLGGGINYMLTDHIAIDLPLSAPFKHKLNGDGSIHKAGELGDVKVIPATLLAQYRFGDPAATVRPYVGGGLTYAFFYGHHSTRTLSALTGGTLAKPTTQEVESKLGSTLQAGIQMELGSRWFLDATVLKTFLKTKGKLSTGQTIDITLDPVSVSLGIGKHF